MPAQRSKRSRKPRSPGSAPRAVASTRREARTGRAADVERQRQRGRRQLGREGERPEGPFGRLPVSELAIFAGIIGAVVGFLDGGGPALVVGLIVCALGVCEIIAREHFSGYRSHTAMLAAIPAVAIEVGLVALFHDPQQRSVVLMVVVPVFGILFWLLRRRFALARQARVARAARAQVPSGVS